LPQLKLPGVLIQRFNEKIGENLSVLRAHIDTRVNSEVLVAKLDNKLKFVVADLKEVGIAALFCAHRFRGMTALRILNVFRGFPPAALRLSFVVFGCRRRFDAAFAKAI
jgi:hypothetical protein